MAENDGASANAKRASSMRRQILVYMPANLIPAIMAVATVVVYTRLLSPREFGAYNLGFSAVLFANGSLFYAMQTTVLRMYPNALKEMREKVFLRTLWTGIAGLTAIVSIIVAACLLLLPMQPLIRQILWCALPVLALRSAVGVTQAQNRSEGVVRIFVAVECLNAVVSFGVGLALIYFVARTGLSAMTGLLAAGFVCLALTCSKTVRLALQGRYDAALMRQIIKFVLPLAGAYFVTNTLAYADRFFVEMLAGPSTLGVYAVAFALVERPTTLLCTLITTATFPIAVKAMEHEGIEAARAQERRNGAALLALAIPACAGLAFSSHYIAAVLVGKQYTHGVGQLLPPLALAALVRNTGTHYLDHAFHLLRRSDLMLTVYAPAAAVNILLDIFLIPHFGAFGAVCGSLVSLSGAIIASTTFAVKYFGLRWPIHETARILGAVTPMVLVLSFLHPPLTLLGLCELVSAGGATYLVAATVLDVSNARKLVTSQLSRLVIRRRAEQA